MSFFIGNCPICHQGMQEILKECETKKIYICCDECEAEWKNADDAMINKNATRLHFGTSKSATIKDIEKKGWTKYIIFSDMDIEATSWILEKPEK